MSGGPAPGVATMARKPGLAMPRELVLASAGSGKTHHISSRLIGLLAAGAPPDQVFASTFTRKAAGEILDRVLSRIAEAAVDASRAGELARAALGASDPDFWSGLLERLARNLHRVDIGTLDAFFIRTARSFAHELELPPGWSIADETSDARIRSQAIQAVLQGTGLAELIELVRLLDRNAAGRSVHDSLLGLTDGLMRVAHETDPLAGEPWAAFGTRVFGSGDRPAGAPPGPAEAAALADRIAALEVPRYGNGNPSRHWPKALADAGNALRSHDWDALLRGSLVRRVAEWRSGLSRTPPEYDRIAMDPECLAVLGEAADMARAALAPGLAGQAEAMRRLAALLSAAFARRRREAGEYSFEDVTRLLGGDDPIGSRPDLWYRLDARARHILLDEFQDTSLAQWEAIRPLLDELMSGYEDERAAVVVADPKQCIYGWRGAEPRVVHGLTDRYGLAPTHFAGSWRSSRVVLDFVNTVFADIRNNEVLADEGPLAAAAAEWAEAFQCHQPRRDLPGHVRIVVGPPDAGRGSVWPNLCRFAAARVAELHRDAPGLSIGVLTRQNQVVARMIHELQELGVRASEEGGNPLTDSAATATVVALLRLADHPGDQVARYHVASTPLGAAVGLTDPADEAAARRLALRVRRQLLDDGYGATLAALARRIEDACDARQRRRLHQLVEAGFRHDARPTLRPGDFVRKVEAERVEDPTGADVRVMTVHQAKGLEFDIVVLPELDADIFRGGGREPIVRRDPDTRRVVEAFPYIPAHVRSVFPEVWPAFDELRQAVTRDALSGLYVALTRARHAVHIVLKPNGSGSRAVTAARIVRRAVGSGGKMQEGQVVFEAGDPEWRLRLPDRKEDRGAAGQPAARPEETAVRLRPADRRSRSLPRRAPSDLAGADHVDLRYLLRLDTAPSIERGSVAHAWFEEIEWLVDGLPSEARLREIATEAAPGMSPEDVATLLLEFRQWLGAPAVSALLRRDGNPAGSLVQRETPFLLRDGDVVVEGIIDRLVLEPGAGGTIAGAAVIDFKTDTVDPEDTDELDRRTEHYRPQMEAYRRAVARRYRLDPGRVAARLLFVRAGAVRDV